MRLYDILRSIVTNAMLAALLFTLARPKYRPQTLWVALAAIVSLNLALNVFFYLQNDYTTLGKLDILFFILVGVAVKSLFRDCATLAAFSSVTAAVCGLRYPFVPGVAGHELMALVDHQRHRKAELADAGCDALYGLGTFTRVARIRADAPRAEFECLKGFPPIRHDSYNGHCQGPLL